MTQELFNHLKQVEPGRTSLPLYFFRQPLDWPPQHCDNRKEVNHG